MPRYFRRQSSIHVHGVGIGGVVLPPVPVEPPPAVGTEVVLSMKRFDGGAGSTMVSNGIPLTPGLLTAAQLGQVRVYVGGVEQAIYVEALYGKHTDGSLRAILVQFDYNIPDANAIAAKIVFGGGARGTTDIALRTAPMLPTAVALPTDPAYLIATKLGGRLTPASATARTPKVAQFLDDVVSTDTRSYTSYPTWSSPGISTFGRAYTRYQMYLRTGDLTYWKRAADLANNFITTYYSVKPGGVNPWYYEPEMMVAHYWLTGNVRTRYETRHMGEMLAWRVRSGTSGYPLSHKGDDRERARALRGVIACRLLEIETQPADASSQYTPPAEGAAYYAQFLTPATLPLWLPGILDTQRTNGEFGGWQYSGGVWDPAVGGQSNYMVGELMLSFIWYYEQVDPDPRIPVAIKKCIDDMWANEWLRPAWEATRGEDSWSFQYNSLRGTKADTTAQDSNPHPLPNLNMFDGAPMAWYYSISGDATYRARFDECLAGLQSDNASLKPRMNWMFGARQYEEATYCSLNAIAYTAA